MTPLLVFLNLLALWLLVRADVSGRVLLFAGAGAAIGLAAVGRAAVLIFAPLAVLWAGLPVRAGRGGAPNAAVRGERAVRGGAGGPAGAGEGWRRAASLVFGMLMVVAPVTIRNYAVSGDLIPITSNGGLNFYIGNGEIATGGYAKPEGLDIVDDPGGESIAESALGRDLTPSEVSSYWYSRAWYHIGSDVPGWARLLVRKLSFALSSYEFPQLENYDFQRQYSALLSLPLPGFAIVGPLGLVGLAMAMGRRRSRILALFFMGYIASLVVFFVLARYRLPVVPVLAVGASYAVVRAYDMIRAGAVRRVAAPALAVAALAFVVNGNLYSVDRLTPYAQIHYRLGIIYGDRGDVARALNEYRRAIEIDPDYPQSYLNLGALLAREGRLDEAVSVFEEAIGIAPRYANAWLNLGMAQIAGGRLDQAIDSLDTAVSLDPGSAAALTQLGVALYRAGREEEALDALSRAESLDDGSERAEIEFYRALATGSTAAEALTEDAARAVARADSLTQRGRAVEAAEVLREASVMAPNSGVPLQRLALLERNMGLLQEAVGHMREALRVEPTIAHGNFMLGVLLNESGRHDAAIRAYEAEVRIDPSYAPAHRNLATAYLYHLADRNRAILHYQEYVRLGGEPVPPLEEALGGADSPGE